MKNRTLIKSAAAVLLFIAVFSLVPAVAKASAASGADDPSNKCFAQFEKCMNEVRVGFLKAFIDALDCELQLAACIKNALKI